MDDTKPTNVVPMYIACAKWFISSQINDLHFSLLAGPDLLLQFSSRVSSRIKRVAAPQYVGGPGPEMEFLESFSPCFSQSLLLADFKGNYTLL
jgi:hypothetical protein